MARYSIFNFAGRLLVVVDDGFELQQRSMTAVACGGVRQYTAVRLSPIVVVRQVTEAGGTYSQFYGIVGDIFGM